MVRHKHNRKHPAVWSPILQPSNPSADSCALAALIQQRHDADLRRTATAAFEDHQISAIERVRARLRIPFALAAGSHSIATRCRQRCQCYRCDRFLMVLLRTSVAGQQTREMENSLCE